MWELKRSLLFLFLITTGDCHRKTRASRPLRSQVNRLTKITEVLQQDVNDIWAVLSKVDAKSRHSNNKLEQDDNFKVIVNETVLDMKTLKTEVESLVHNTRNGFRNEKMSIRKQRQKWREETLTFYKKVDERVADFKFSMVELQSQLRGEPTEIKTELNVTNAGIADATETNRLAIESLNKELNIAVGELSHADKEIQDLKLSLARQEQLLKTLVPAITQTQVKGDVCEAGWLYFIAHCYMISDTPKLTWLNASQFCSERNAYLVEIDFDEEMQFIISSTTASSIWVGVSDRMREGTFLWQTSRKPVPQRYWASREPNNKFDGEDCGELVKHTGKMNDNDCKRELRFVCEKTSNGLSRNISEEYEDSIDEYDSIDFRALRLY